jgi:hypothetical protein
MGNEFLSQQDKFILIRDEDLQHLPPGAIIVVRKRFPFGGCATAACVRSFDLESRRAIPDWPHSITIKAELMRIIHPHIWVEYARGYYPGILCEIIQSNDGFNDGKIVTLLEYNFIEIIVGLRRDYLQRYMASYKPSQIWSGWIGAVPEGL